MGRGKCRLGIHGRDAALSGVGQLDGEFGAILMGDLWQQGKAGYIAVMQDVQFAVEAYRPLPVDLGIADNDLANA